MGLRIIDRRDRQLLERMQTMRTELLRQEAERFGAFKGGDPQKNQEDFLGKISGIRNLIDSTHLAHEVVDRLEKTIKEANKASIRAVGPLEPNLVLELL